MSTSRPPADVFAEELGKVGARVVSVAERAALGERLVRACREGAAAWPGVRLPDEVYVAYLAGRLPEGPVLAALESMKTDELYLTCACGRGDAAALAAFERDYLGELAAALSHLKLPAVAIDEVRQSLRQRLFVVSEGGGAPKIDEVSGRGELRGLLRVAAVRLALDLLRKQKREHLVGDERELPPSVTAIAAGDMELELVKGRHRDAFKQCFEEALAALSKRERTVLRLHVLDGLTVEQVGTSYGVHRATATRWLAGIREQLLADTRKRLKEKLRLGEDDLREIFDEVQSRLDVSFDRLLRTTMVAADADTQ